MSTNRITRPTALARALVVAAGKFQRHPIANMVMGRAKAPRAIREAYEVSEQSVTINTLRSEQHAHDSGV